MVTVATARFQYCLAATVTDRLLFKNTINSGSLTPLQCADSCGTSAYALIQPGKTLSNFQCFCVSSVDNMPSFRAIQEMQQVYSLGCDMPCVDGVNTCGTVETGFMTTRAAWSVYQLVNLPAPNPLPSLNPDTSLPPTPSPTPTTPDPPNFVPSAVTSMPTVVTSTSSTISFTASTALRFTTVRSLSITALPALQRSSAPLTVTVTATDLSANNPQPPPPSNSSSGSSNPPTAAIVATVISVALLAIGLVVIRRMVQRRKEQLGDIVELGAREGWKGMQHPTKGMRILADTDTVPALSPPVRLTIQTPPRRSASLGGSAPASAAVLLDRLSSATSTNWTSTTAPRTPVLASDEVAKMMAGRSLPRLPPAGPPPVGPLPPTPGMETTRLRAGTGPSMDEKDEASRLPDPSPLTMVTLPRGAGGDGHRVTGWGVAEVVAWLDSIRFHPEVTAAFAGKQFYCCSVV
ncbi:hypothetical protein HK101_004718 [Irineochytrium annulatum]|nr:hypothetical protein HK101_004718 [Irineochytrium annulatum]